jgi:hypothetical protein
MRIFHLDFNFVSQRQEFVRDLLARVAAMGYDAILWEMENQVVWETCPECATPESWSKSSFRELLRYSRELGLEPIPLLQTIGHGEYVMSHPRYHAFREHPDFCDCYCVSKPGVRDFLRRWIREYCDLFGDLRYFHLGGDEAYQFGHCPKCSTRDRQALYGEHVNALAEELRKRQIRPGIWSDMIMAEPAKLGSIPHDIIVWDWNYSNGVSVPKAIHVAGVGTLKREEIAPDLLQRIPELLDAAGNLNPFYTTDILMKRGFDVVLSSAARSSTDGPFCPNTTVHALNIAAVDAKYRSSRLFGHCVTSWSIRLNPITAGLPLMEMPRISAAAPDAGLDAWRRRASLPYFGFEGGLDAADLLGHCNSGLRPFSAVQWTGLKDARPTPPGFMAKRIAQWEEEREPWWLNKDTMLAAMQSDTRAGLAMLEPYADKYPVAALWVRAGRLQLDYIGLLQHVFAWEATPATRRPRILEFRAAAQAFYESEQAPLSAARNAGLLVDLLLDLP